ncbi:MAG: hypothetical protein A2X94_14170 [Bdellovibrionales bacterium GWB1_55_8]|nr:MAG: hypothetical protein A2X94_14170 [Bdellovibrionales bacterium GWB1_55_8]
MNKNLVRLHAPDSNLSAALERIAKLEAELEKNNKQLSSANATRDTLAKERDKDQTDATKARRVAASLMLRAKKIEKQLEEERRKTSENFAKIKEDWTKVVDSDSKLRLMLQQLQQKNTALTEDSIFRDARLKVLEAERVSWRGKYDELDGEIIRLRQQLEGALRAGGEKAESTNELQQKIQHSGKALQEAREHAERLTEELEQTRQALADQRRAKRSLELQLGETERATARSNEQLERVNAELERLRNITATFEAQRHEWLKKEDAATARLNEMSQEVMTARQHSEDEIRGIREQLEHTISDLQLALGKSRDETEKQLELKNSLWRELVNAEREREQAKSHSENSSSKLMQAALEHERDRVEHSEEIEKLRNSLVGEEKRNSDLTKEMARLQQLSETAMARLQDELQGLKQRISEHEITKHTLSDHLARSERDIDTHKNEIKRLTGELDALKQQREELQRENAHKEAEISRLLATVDHERELVRRSEAAHQVDRVALEGITVKLREVEDFRNRLSEKLQLSEAAREESHREILRFQQELSTARHTGGETEKARNLLHAELNRSQQDLQRAEETIKRLQAEAKQADALYLRMSEERRDLVRRADQAYEEVHQLKLQLAENKEQFQKAFSESVGQLQEKLARAEEQRADLERQEAQRREDVSRLRGELAESAEAISDGRHLEDRLREELRNVHQTVNDTKLALELGKKDVAKWEELFERESKEREALVRDVKEKQGKIQALKETLLEKNEELKDIEAMRDDLAAREAEAKRENVRLSAELTATKDRLNQEQQHKSVVFAEARRLKDEVVRASETSVNAESAKKALWEELVGMERGKAELLRQAEQLRGEITAVKAELERMKSDKSVIAFQEEKARDRIVELTGQLEDSEETVRRLENDIAVRERNELEYRKEIERLRSDSLRAEKIAQDNDLARQARESKLQDELHRSVKSKEESALEVVRLKQQLAIAEKAVRNLSQTEESLATRLVAVQLESERLAQALEQSEQTGRELENRYDVLNKTSLERQFETDRLKRELERVSKSLEKSDRERRDLATKEGIARFEIERLKKMAEPTDAAIEPWDPAPESPSRHGSA